MVGVWNGPYSGTCDLFTPVVVARVGPEVGVGSPVGPGGYVNLVPGLSGGREMVESEWPLGGQFGPPGFILPGFHT